MPRRPVRLGPLMLGNHEQVMSYVEGDQEPIDGAQALRHLLDTIATELRIDRAVAWLARRLG